MTSQAEGLRIMKRYANPERWNHGDRLRYLAGCRCEDCRAGNAAYARERRQARLNGDWDGYVLAGRVRRHLLKLQRQGVGRDAVAAATDIPHSTIRELRIGKRRHLRASTERKLLAVTQAQIADRGLVSAGPTWKLIDELVEEGYTKQFLAKQLGFAGRGLCLGKVRITARNAYRVERLHRALTE